MRGTQSLLHICADCWRRPRLLAWELLWRWGFGIPAAILLCYRGAGIMAGVSPALSGLSPTDPVQAAQQLAMVAAAIKPQVEHIALLLGPVLALAWAIASGLGRSAVIRRLDPALRPARLTLILLQMLRIAALIAAVLGWFRALDWAADATLNGASPNLVAYSACVICLSLGIFFLWALLSWIFSIAPVLAILENTGVSGSLARSFRLGPLTGKLVEVNLVLGIVRLALIVLATVFSATPLPFAAEMTGAPLYLWWALITLLYFVASDFFQVARFVAFIRFWRFYHPGEHPRNSLP